MTRWTMSLLLLLIGSGAPASIADGTGAGQDALEVMDLDTLRLERADIGILDVRSMDLYLEGHIPGAHPLDVERLRATILDAAEFDPEAVLAVLRDIPLRHQQRVVVYGSTYADRQDGLAAWLLAQAGISRVMILDGGFPAWNRRRRLGVYQGYPSSLQRLTLRPEDLAPRPEVRRDSSLTPAGSVPGEAVLHILPPSAAGTAEAEFASNAFLAADGSFLFPEDLEALLRRRQIDPDALLVLRGQLEHATLAWAALTGNGFKAVVEVPTPTESQAGDSP